MPVTEVVFFAERAGTVPVLDWLDGLPLKARDKCFVRIERLAALGHEMRRPEADYLRDGIYELRIRMGRVNYRILYFFHRRRVVVLAHGLTKEEEVPERDIEVAIRRGREFTANPGPHTHRQ